MDLSTILKNITVLQIMAFAVIFFLPISAICAIYLAETRTNERKRISARGINALNGKCPICSGKLKIVNLFPGRSTASPYKIGAARCTKCRHLEVFSEEP